MPLNTAGRALRGKSPARALRSIRRVSGVMNPYLDRSHDQQSESVSGFNGHPKKFSK
jgi:hypothetical protein